MQESPTYYIGDSKYYKIGHELGDESIYKQYTYARNVIQWNIDILNAGKEPESGVKLRDELTEGYNIIPNFFISAKFDESFDYDNDGLEKTDREHNKHKKTHFSNRLFDRDTLLLFHYDVNFLFVLSMYARDNAMQKKVWKEEIRDKFRSEVQDWLKDDYDFYAMKARQGVDAKAYFLTHFRDILGKTYCPFTNEEIFSLALDNNDPDGDNDSLLSELRKYFYVEPCNLGDNLEEIIEDARNKETGIVAIPNKDGVLVVKSEDYLKEYSKFCSNGLYAIGIDSNLDTIKIVQNIASINYVLFQEDNDSQHLFSLKNTCEIKEDRVLEVETMRNLNYKNIYVVLDIDTSVELDTSDICVTPVETVSRPIYVTIDEIKNK